MAFNFNVQLKLKYDAAVKKLREDINKAAKNIAVSFNLPQNEVNALRKSVEAAISGIGIVFDPHRLEMTDTIKAIKDELKKIHLFDKDTKIETQDLSAYVIKLRDELQRLTTNIGGRKAYMTWAA